MKRMLMLLGLLVTEPLAADPPDILDATARQTGDNWRFDVTLRHPDTGWDHFADGWEVLAPDGTRLGFRELYHPHVEEQPFTRALSGVVIPEGVSEVFIRARCNVTGWSDVTYPISLFED